MWFYAQRGSRWEAPHAIGGLPCDCLFLLSAGRFWVAVWVDDPADRRLEIDVCLPPEREHDGWTYVDLELDPIRHESGIIQIEDYDEVDAVRRNGWITPENARIALETASAMEASLRKREEPLGDEGWMRLNILRRNRI